MCWSPIPPTYISLKPEYWFHSSHYLILNITCGTLINWTTAFKIHTPLVEGLPINLLYYTILYYTILYYTILYYTILYYTNYYTILYYTILYYTILYYAKLYNLYKDSCPLIGWFAFIILTIYRIRLQNILLHSVWVGKSAKIIYYCTHRLLLY